MKTKYYRYGASNEAQEFIDLHFGSNEIDAEIDDTKIVLQTTKDGEPAEIWIGYKVIDEPLVFAGHTFEELRDYRIEFTIGDKVFTTKSLQHKLTNAQIVEKSVTTWFTAMTKVSRSPVTNVTRMKIQEERELLKALKAPKAAEIPETQDKKAKKTQK